MWLNKKNINIERKLKSFEIERLKNDPNAFNEELMKSSNVEKRVSAANRFLNSNPDHTDALITLGLEFAKEKKYLKASNYLKKASDLLEKEKLSNDHNFASPGLDRKIKLVYNELASVYLSTKNYPQSTIYCLKLIYKKNYESIDGWSYLGRIYLAKKQFLYAEECILKSLGIVEERIEGWLNFVNEQYREYRWTFSPQEKTNKFNFLFEYFEQTIEYIEKLPFLYNQLALVYKNMGKLDHATDILSVCLNPPVNYLKVYNKLIKMYKKASAKTQLNNTIKRLEWLKNGGETNNQLYQKIKKIKNAER